MKSKRREKINLPFDVEKPLAEMAERREARYLLVNVVLKRSRELYSGAKPLVKASEGSDAGTIAFRELTTDRLRVIPRKTPTRLVDLAKRDQ